MSSFTARVLNAWAPSLRLGRSASRGRRNIVSSPARRRASFSGMISLAP